MAHILVTDDNDELRRMVMRMLTSAGHAVSEAADGGQALELCRAGHVDVILLDVYMPESDGLETIRMLRGMAKRPRIVMMSGGSRRYRLSDGDLLDHANMLGADASLKKPFRQAELLKVIDDVLQADAGPLARYRRLAADHRGREAQ